MEDNKRRRRLLQRALVGWVLASGLVPATALAETDALAIREPSLGRAGEGIPAAPEFQAVREPVASKPFRPIREPQVPGNAVPTRAVDIEGSPESVAAALPTLPDSEPSASDATAPVQIELPANRSNGANALAASDREAARWLRKQALAKQVSSEILGHPASGTVAPPRPNVSTITSRRLAQQAAARLSEARRQADRGVRLSAQVSAFEALRLIADANDLLGGHIESALALQQARTALRESQDFAGRFGPVGPDAIARMAASHQTPILQNCETAQLNGSRATDIYLDHARAKFAEVAEANPIAIEALVVLAEVERETDPPSPLSDAVVISLLRAALQAGPNDPVVANELGYQLLKQGLLEEAQWALEHSFRLHPTRSAGINLAETLRQRGDLSSARAMIAKLERIPPAAARRPQVYALSPEQFAALSQATAPPQTEFAPRSAPAASAPKLPAAAVGPTPVTPVQPAEPKGPVGRVADAVSQIWK